MNRYDEWILAKENERQAIEYRRELEDEMVRDFGVSETFDGTLNLSHDGYKIKITGKMNRKVDLEVAEEIAIENGLESHLRNLFRFKAEINAANWKASDPSITTPLLAAITTTAGRPAFSIEKE